MSASLRLIRFARMTALFANVLTIFCAILIVGWQIIVFLREGNWQALPLSFVFNSDGRNDVYSTASIAKIERGHLVNLADALLQAPVIMPLLLAAVLLTAFYSWLSNIERRYSEE